LVGAVLAAPRPCSAQIRGAARPGRNGYDMQRGQDQSPELQQRQAMLQQQFAQIGQTIDGWLVALLKLVNESKKPDAAFLASAEKVVQESTGSLSRFDRSLVCEHHLLNAWVQYFKGDAPSAFLLAGQAQGADADNHDAYVSQVALALVADRQPQIIPSQRPPIPAETTQRDGTMTRARRPRPSMDRSRPMDTREQTTAAQVNVQTQSGDILQYEPEGLVVPLLGQNLPVMQMQCVNGATLSYAPGAEGLCMLVWKSPQTAPATGTVRPGEPNSVPRPGVTMMRTQTPTAAPARRSGLPDLPPPPGASASARTDPRMQDRGMPGRDERYDYGYDRAREDPYSYRGAGIDTHRSDSAARPGLEASSQAFTELFATYVGKPDLKFVGLNLDVPDRREVVLAQVVSNPRPWAEVLAQDAVSPEGPVAQLFSMPGIDLTRPMLVIADGSGKVRYAGPAEGFVPRLLLDHLTGSGAIALGTPSVTPTAPAVNPLSQILQRMTGQGAPPTDSTPPTPREVKPPIQADRDEPPNLLEQPDLIEAEKQLSYAKNLFIPLGNKRMMSSKRGVDICREIMQRWPGTKYAEEARGLLRQLSETDRRRYNITNEELGL